MKKKMPGFQDAINKINATQQAEEKKAQEKKKQKELVKMQLKKLGAAFKYTNKKNPVFSEFLRAFFRVQFFIIYTW